MLLCVKELSCDFIVMIKSINNLLLGVVFISKQWLSFPKNSDDEIYLVTYLIDIKIQWDCVLYGCFALGMKRIMYKCTKVTVL